ncbi:MAG: hypothetical protein ACLFUJ_10440 [Phycisphaerae bacterium]
MPQFMPILRKGRFRLNGRQQLCAAHLGPAHQPPVGDDELADQVEAPCCDDLARAEPEATEDIERQAEQQSPPGPPLPVTARIVEQIDGVAVIEVTCHCGEVIHVQCFVGHNHRQADSPPGPQGQKTPPVDAQPAGLSTHPKTPPQRQAADPKPAQTEPEAAGEQESDPFNFTPPEIQDENDA